MVFIGILISWFITIPISLGLYHPLYTANNEGFGHCSPQFKWYIQKLPLLLEKNEAVTEEKDISSVFFGSFFGYLFLMMQVTQMLFSSLKKCLYITEVRSPKFHTQYSAFDDDSAWIEC